MTILGIYFGSLAIVRLGAFAYFCSLINQMEIIPANSKDIKALNRLVNSAYRGEESKNGWTTEVEILDGIRIDEQALEELFVRSEVVILKSTSSNGVILGTVCLEVRSHDLYLGMFAISPLSQGNGLGKALLSAAEEFALENGCSRIVISVIGTRVELIEWYGRHGYIATGSSIAFEEIEGRFGDPKVPDINLIEMEKVLKRS